MILLIPVVLVLLGRLSARLPVVLRYAVRDAARHRTRTVPAVAAVAATVAGVVALGIGVTSDAYENEATYEATLPEGTGLLTSYGEHPLGRLRRSGGRRGPGGNRDQPHRGSTKPGASRACRPSWSWCRARTKGRC